MPECVFKLGDRLSKKKRRNSVRRAICNATRGIDAGRGVIRHRGVSDDSDGARPLWRSHSARTEMFFADARSPWIFTCTASLGAVEKPLDWSSWISFQKRKWICDQPQRKRVVLHSIPWFNPDSKQSPMIWLVWSLTAIRPKANTPCFATLIAP